MMGNTIIYIYIHIFHHLPGNLVYKSYQDNSIYIYDIFGYIVVIFIGNLPGEYQDNQKFTNIYYLPIILYRIYSDILSIIYQDNSI